MIPTQVISHVLRNKTEMFQEIIMLMFFVFFFKYGYIKKPEYYKFKGKRISYTHYTESKLKYASLRMCIAR